MRLIPIVFLLMILPACSMSPLQYSFLRDLGLRDDSYIVMSDEEIRTKLDRYSDVTVGKGVYRIPKPGDVPIGAWCSPTGSYQRKDWVCTHYANWAAEEMKGFAFGVARDGNHRLNIHLVDDNGEIRIAHYDPQRCEWVASNIEHVVIVPFDDIIASSLFGVELITKSQHHTTPGSVPPS